MLEGVDGSSLTFKLYTSGCKGSMVLYNVSQKLSYIDKHLHKNLHIYNLDFKLIGHHWKQKDGRNFLINDINELQKQLIL